jgi:hypothetical protein
MIPGSTQPLIEMSTRNLPGCKGRSVRKAISSPSVSRFSRKCGSVDVSQSYAPSWLVTGIVLHFFTLLSFSCSERQTNPACIFLSYAANGWFRFKKLAHLPQPAVLGMINFSCAQDSCLFCNPRHGISHMAAILRWQLPHTRHSVQIALLSALFRSRKCILWFITLSVILK